MTERTPPDRKQVLATSARLFQWLRENGHTSEAKPVRVAIAPNEHPCRSKAYLVTEMLARAEYCSALACDKRVQAALVRAYQLRPEIEHLATRLNSLERDRFDAAALLGVKLRHQLRGGAATGQRLLAGFDRVFDHLGRFAGVKFPTSVSEWSRFVNRSSRTLYRAGFSVDEIETFFGVGMSQGAVRKWLQRLRRSIRGRTPPDLELDKWAPPDVTGR